MYSRYTALLFGALILTLQLGLRCDAQEPHNGEAAPSPSKDQAASRSDAVIHLNESGATLNIFTNLNQELTPGSLSDTVATGKPATIVSSGKRGLTLYRGMLLVKSGRHPATVRVSEADIHLSPQSTVIIVYAPRTSLKIQVIKSDNPILMELCSDTTSSAQFKLRAKEELNVDFTLHRVTMQAYQERPEAAFPLVDGHCGSLQRSNAPLKLTGSAGTEFRVSSTGVPELLSGRIFVRTDGDETIHTTLGDLVLHHAVASIERWDGQLRLASFSEPEAIAYRSNTFQHCIRWGEELVVTEHAPTWGDLMPDDGVARRKFIPLCTSPTHCTLAEFQLASALKNQPHLLVIRRPRSDQDLALKNQLLKTAIALEFVSGAKGRFITANDLSPVSTAINHQTPEGSNQLKHVHHSPGS